MVWPTLGSRTAEKQNITKQSGYSTVASVHQHRVGLILAVGLPVFPPVRLPSLACTRAPVRPFVHPRKPRPVAIFTIRLLYIDYRFDVLSYLAR